MDIGRHEVSEFKYASSGAGLFSIMDIGTANTDTTQIRITDINVSNGAGAGSLKLYVSSYGSYGQPLKVKIPASALDSCNFQIPYSMQVVASTVEPRRFLASVIGAETSYVITGYLEK